MQRPCFLGPLACLAIGWLSWGTLPGGNSLALAQHRPLKLEVCLVSALYDIQVPAQQPGVLREIHVREGQHVRPGALMALVDDASAQRAYRIAQIQYQQAAYEAENDIDVRYAEAAAKVAKAELDAAVLSNRKVPGAINPSEIRRLQLAHHRAVLAIEQARRDHQVAQFTKQIRQAELQEAEDQLGRHRITQPLAKTAIVVEIFKQLGEWVQPGDPVFRIMRLDRVRVDGFVDARLFGPQEVQRRRVEVLATLERGRQERFQGVIVAVHPVVQQDGHYRVRAEVENRLEQGQWVLRPGHQVQMTIRMDLPPVPPPTQDQAAQEGLKPARINAAPAAHESR